MLACVRARAVQQHPQSAPASRLRLSMARGSEAHVMSPTASTPTAFSLACLCCNVLNVLVLRVQDIGRMGPEGSGGRRCTKRWGAGGLDSGPKPRTTRVHFP